jgi:GH25 family lysozyme M1 (1,4-beta-N-acetylmuramidase)
MRGIDLSHHNKVTSWSKVKDGNDFCILKATQGTTWVDEKFREYRLGAENAGFLMGFYHFADGTDAVKEAQHFVETVGVLKEGQFLVLDYEINLKNPADWCVKWLDYIYNKTGVRPLLYTNEARMKTNDWSKVIKGGYGLWVAKYGTNTGEMQTAPTSGQWPFWAIWQYTSKGKVPGIVGNVDLNYTKMDLETLKKYGNPATTPPEPQNQPESDLNQETMKPLANWDSLPRGYKFGQKTWYNSRHLGTDFVTHAETPVYAWDDIKVTSSYWGTQCGNTTLVEYKGKLFRFCHLYKKSTIGNYKRGQIFALTGNTGALTTGAHLHLDISKNGKLNIWDFNNFIDPEVYFAKF